LYYVIRVLYLCAFDVQWYTQRAHSPDNFLKKILAYTCIAFGVTVLAVAYYRPLLLSIWNWNNSHPSEGKWYRIYHSPWGDLTSQANLDGVKKFREPKSFKYIRPPGINKRTVALFVFGDSYTKDIPDSVFCNTAAYHFGHVTGKFELQPERALKNVLIIEMTERNARAILHSTVYFEEPSKLSNDMNGGEGRKNYSSFVNKSLKYLLVDYNFMNTVKNYKAEMTLSLFGRMAGNGAVSDNGKYLFLKNTVKKRGKFSSYDPLPDTEIHYLVSKLNGIYDHFRAKGYDEVYLSMIPNPATVLQPERYNMLIPLIQQSAELRMPVVDIYSYYKASPDPESFYRMGDTHWNNKGMQVWIGMVNDKLIEY